MTSIIVTQSPVVPQKSPEQYQRGKDGLTLGEQISRIIATSAGETVADSPLPDSFDGLTRNEIIYHSYLRGLIADRTELARLAPIAPLYEYKLNVWRNEGGIIGTVTPKIGLSVLWGMGGVPATITNITAWGITVWRSGWEDSTTVYPEHLSDLWLAEDSVSPDSIKPVTVEKIEWIFDCQGFNDDGLLCQHFNGRDTTNGNQFYRTINQHGIYTRPHSCELTLGDFVEADEPAASPYPPTPQDHYDLTNLIGYREDGHYILQMPQDHPLADLLEAWLTLQHANPILADAGYDVAALKNTLTLPRPKTVKKAIDFAITTLKLAQEHGRFAGEANQKLGDTDNTAWETRYIGDVVTKLEGLL